MAISAQTLFHFTKFQNLKSILEAKAFYPRLSFEAFMSFDNHIVAFPMVCFCDIPLSQIYSHAIKYFSNGIGLEKEWGIKNKLNPVYYLEKGSYPSIVLKEIFEEIKTMVFANPGNKFHINTDETFFIKKSLEMAAFYKPRRGKAWGKDQNSFLKYSKNSQKYKQFDFYDEREWRFVPKIVQEINQRLIEADYWKKSLFYKGNEFKEKYYNSFNKKYEDKKLYFDPIDVKYIIVNKKNYIQYLVDFIWKLDKKVYSEHEKSLLSSKIISLSQIKEDF